MEIEFLPSFEGYIALKVTGNEELDSIGMLEVS